jgi:hypothetical protein
LYPHTYPLRKITLTAQTKRSEICPELTPSGPRVMPPLELGPTGQVIPEISTTLKVNNWGDRWGDNESRKTRFIFVWPFG